MKKHEIELIVFNVSSDGQEAFNMKIYKDGTTCRRGVGALPPVDINGMSFFNDSRYFDPLIEKVPQEILDNPINHEEPIKNGYIEYVMAFYGVSSNGQTGEHAKWSKSTGVRVKLDHQTQFNHPIMQFLDGLSQDAAELTNDWYFDIVMQTVFKATNRALPKQTLLSAPKTEADLQEAFERYINQMHASVRRWDINQFIKDKIYVKDGFAHGVVIDAKGDKFNMSFEAIAPDLTDLMTEQIMKSQPQSTKKAQPENTKPWWKFW